MNIFLVLWVEFAPHGMFFQLVIQKVIQGHLKFMQGHFGPFLALQRVTKSSNTLISKYCAKFKFFCIIAYFWQSEHIIIKCIIKNLIPILNIYYRIPGGYWICILEQLLEVRF